MPDGPCLYCREPKLLVSVCLDCRTKFESARRELERVRREAEGWRRRYFRLMNERVRAKKRR